MLESHAHKHQQKRKQSENKRHGRVDATDVVCDHVENEKLRDAKSDEKTLP